MPLCVGKDLWPCSSMANIVTHLWSNYYIFVTSGSGEKNFLNFFNIRFMGKKLNSKNYLTHAPTAILSWFRSKTDKNKGMILGKFRSDTWPGT